MIKEFKNEYRWLSNFYSVEINYKGRAYHNVENAFHSEKSGEVFFKDFCAQESNPRVVKKEQRNMILLRSDWEDVKYDIMLGLIRIKFQNKDLRLKLISTHNELIEEKNNRGDSYWGVDLETGIGENNLGKILMTVRNEILWDDYFDLYLRSKKKIVIFDEKCALCDMSIDFLARIDRRDTFRFVGAQSSLGNYIFRRYGILESTIDSVIFINNSDSYTIESSAILNILKDLPFPWYLLCIGYVLPKKMRDYIYRFISKNRYQWFGKKDMCSIRSEKVKIKMLKF